MRRRYGAGPVHLVAVLSCFVLTGYAVSRVVGDRPAVVRIAVWFVGAAVAWDLVLGPALALGDRGLRAVLRRPLADVVPLNHVRVPLLLSGLLLLVSAPLVLRRSQDVYAAKTGLSEQPYLGRWLIVTAVLFAASALLFGLRVVRARRR